MSTLFYNLANTVNLTGADAQVNAATEHDITSAYDLAFFGIGNFLQGTYIQKSSNQDDIQSSITINGDGVDRMRMFYASADAAAGERSDYGDSVDGTKASLFFGDIIHSVKDQENNNQNLRFISQKSYANTITLHPLVNSNDASGAVDSSDSSNVLLLKDKCSVGDGLLQLVSAAIFKKLGKNAALINDSALVTTLNTNFQSSLETGFGETDASYSDSAFFKRYLESGRYASDSSDINTLIDYDMNDTVVNFILELSGSVSDLGSSPITMDETNVEKIFGSIGTGNSDHKINASGDYTITAFVSLRNDNRF